MSTKTIVKIITVVGALLTGIGQIMQEMDADKQKRAKSNS